MNHTRFHPIRSTARALIACVLALFCAKPLAAATLLDFPLNEGSGAVTTDAASGHTGLFGFAQDPATDTPILMSSSPSGLAGDGSVSVQGNGFLIVTDSPSPVLAFGPDQAITLEAWINIDPNSGRPNEGIISYGTSYKLGMRSAELVFTLYGVVDVVSGFFPPAGQWTHVAAVFEPGVGVTFHMNGLSNFVAETRRMLPTQNNYLILGAERFANSVVAMLDRIRIHSAALSAAELDSDGPTPKAPAASTVVAYNFNETTLPADNAQLPSRPTVNSVDLLPQLSGPAWTNDTPTGAPNDYAVAFNLNNSPIRQRITVDLTGTPLNLGANNTNYTLEAWVKLPTTLINERMVIFRSSGPGPRVSFSIAANRTLHTTVFGTQDITSSVRVPNDSRWHHIAAVMEDFARVRFYLDGVLRQTVNRTGTAAASSATAVNLLIGMESDTRYFKGLLDRVRIHDTALAVEALDFPAAPGLPRFLTTPSDVIVDLGGSVTLEATPSSETPASYQWRFRPSLAASESTEVPGATSTTLVFDNVTLAGQGFYSLVVSNQTGTAESPTARVTVRTAPDALQPLWTIAPGERPYVTPWNSSATLRDLERGMAYNPTTDHLLISARVDSPTIKGIFIIDAQTGAHIGELPGSSIVTGGTIVLTRVVVATDGAIYACNFGTFTDTSPLKIYRWANETTDPDLAYQGNPVTGTGLANQQWGKNMTARGAGTSTQILMDTRSNWLALFTTADGVNFTPTLIQPEARNDAWNLGLVWGENDTFWGKNSFEPLFQWKLNATNSPPALVRSFPDFPGEFFANFSFDEDFRYLGGLSMVSGPDVVELYDLSDLDRGPILLDTAPFTVNNDHTLNYGNVLIARNRIFALSPNSGLLALSIAQISAPSLSIRASLNELAITWPASITGFTLEVTGQLPPSSWTVVSHQVEGQENIARVSPAGSARFFRLRK